MTAASTRSPGNGPWPSPPTWRTRSSGSPSTSCDRRSAAGASGCIGVGAHGLGEPAQLGLFASEDPRRRKAVEAQDEIRRRYGTRALTRARLLGDPLADPGGRDPLQPLQGRRVGRGSSTPAAGPGTPRAPGDGGRDGGAVSEEAAGGLDDAGIDAGSRDGSRDGRRSRDRPRTDGR